jgi:hypothetical protein
MNDDLDLGLCPCGQPAWAEVVDGVACMACMDRQNDAAVARIRRALRVFLDQPSSGEVC